MNRTLNQLGRLIALCLVGSMTVMAQDSQAQDGGFPDFLLKIRGQAGSQTKEGQLNGFGFGVGATYPLLSGKAGLELGYQTFSGNIVRGGLDGTNGYNQSNSVYTKKNTTEMIGLRGSYSREFADGWSWQAGVGIYHSKSRLESIGTFSYHNDGDDNPIIDGAWQDTPEKSGIAFNAFGGVSYSFSDSGSIELNLVVFNYKVKDVAPSIALNSVAPVYSDKSISDVKIEFAYVFHF